jgi:phosphoribosyl-AMP cyclohydrolase
MSRVLTTRSDGSFRVADHSLSVEEREAGTVFAPRFDGNGLLTAVVVDHDSAEVLVVAHMNAEALAKTLETGRVHFWSRSRAALWLKGETSGHFLGVKQVLVDCDQDALVIRAEPAGPTCHTGARSCFYRRIDLVNGSPVLTRTNT